jgi:hypothetical protein
MTNEQRRYAHARNDFKRFHVDKAQELIDAADGVFEAATLKVKETEQMMEELRPVWAQGFSSDSEAAQANGSALAQLWGMLGAVNQTEAVVSLETLIDFRKENRDD